MEPGILNAGPVGIQYSIAKESGGIVQLTRAQWDAVTAQRRRVLVARGKRQFESLVETSGRHLDLT